MEPVIPMTYAQMHNALSKNLNYTIKIKGIEYSVPNIGAFRVTDRPGDETIEIRLTPINSPGVSDTNLSWSSKNIITIDDGVNRLNPGDVVISYSSSYSDDYSGGKRRRRNSKSKKRKSRRNRRKTRKTRK